MVLIARGRNLYLGKVCGTVAIQSSLMTVFLRDCRQHFEDPRTVTGLGRLPESQRTLLMPLLWGYYKLPPACFFLCSKMFAFNLVTDPNPRWGNGTRTPYIPSKRQWGESFVGSHGGAVHWLTLKIASSGPARRTEWLPSTLSLVKLSVKQHRSMFRRFK